jgi:uncharacterized membrane protein YhhN
MKRQAWIILFTVVLIAHLTGLLLKSQLAEYISKPMIVLLLGLYFLSGTNQIPSQFKKWIYAALAFSWFGDVVLMFQEKDSRFFLGGLASFLIAHVFYILFFYSVKTRERVRVKLWILAAVLIYYAALIALLSAGLGDLRLPVYVYGLVISFMFMLAIHMLFIRNRQAGRPMMVGALLFVLSDSMLAVNKFYSSFELAGLLIMLTYGLAQILIVEGAIQYIRNQQRE